MTTRKQITEQLTDYLNHRLPLADLVHWAENAVLEGDIADQEPKVVMKVLGRIAAADAEGFGLLWEDCNAMLHELGYHAEVHITKAA